MSWHFSICGREGREVSGRKEAKGKGKETNATVLAEELLKVALLDAGGETGNVEVVSGVSTLLSTAVVGPAKGKPFDTCF
jgi:hypothetical protein